MPPLRVVLSQRPSKGEAIAGSAEMRPSGPREMAARRRREWDRRQKRRKPAGAGRRRGEGPEAEIGETGSRGGDEQ